MNVGVLGNVTLVKSSFFRNIDAEQRYFGTLEKCRNRGTNGGQVKRRPELRGANSDLAPQVANLRNLSRNVQAVNVLRQGTSLSPDIYNAVFNDASHMMRPSSFGRRRLTGRVRVCGVVYHRQQ